MRILYISVHSILEYDECKLLTELGHDVFSLGAYTDPAGHYSLPRPGIGGMRTRPDLMELVRNMPRTELTWEFLDNFDAIIVMDGHHAPDVIERNWPLFKTKRTIWRTIGQSLPEVEKRLKKFRNEGMKIIRYSPMEEELDNYIGKDVLIRFYKDPDEFGNWTGHVNQVINVSQSLKARRDFCGFDTIMKVGSGFPFKVYGTGNDNLGEYNGGEISYDNLKGAMRDCKVFLYGGTWPASYTLSFIEAMMTGIPMVCAGPDLWSHRDHPSVKLYEIPKILSKGDDGFWSNDPMEMKDYIQKLLTDRSLAMSVSVKARAKAIQLFGKQNIKEQWKCFLETI